jgi:hypothetical protein
MKDTVFWKKSLLEMQKFISSSFSDTRQIPLIMDAYYSYCFERDVKMVGVIKQRVGFKIFLKIISHIQPLWTPHDLIKLQVFSCSCACSTLIEFMKPQTKPS